MKKSLFTLVLAACVLMSLAGCHAASQPAPTPGESGAQESEMISPQPDGTPESGGKETGEADVPKNVAPPAQDAVSASPNQSAHPTELVQTENTAPPSGVAPATGSTPESSRPPKETASQPGGTSQPDTPQSDTPQPDTPEPTAPEISQITRLETGFSSASFSGDDGFEAFLEQGGASNDAQVTEFLATHLHSVAVLSGNPFGCSTIAVKSPVGESLFGRNFDWQACEALVLTSTPSDGYASLSTVNLDFISAGDGGNLSDMLRQNDVRVLAALYAPLDGMNEKGLAVSVNMIQDAAIINQDTGKPDLTTTTAIRLLLNKAASVDEALELLGQYDLHASLGMMVHFALADTTGRSVVVEYIGNRMEVTETPVVTNFYLVEGAKHGVGTAQSHTRYDILIQALEQQTMDVDEVRDALDSVSKDNFGEFESTEWSAVFNLSTGEARYYHRENYEKAYEFSIK